MLSQLLVAAGVTAVCGGLGLTEWLRSRSARPVIAHRPYRKNLRLDDITPTYERITRLTALTGFRRSIRDEDDDFWPLVRRS